MSLELYQNHTQSTCGKILDSVSWNVPPDFENTKNLPGAQDDLMTYRFINWWQKTISTQNPKLLQSENLSLELYQNHTQSTCGKILDIVSWRMQRELANEDHPTEIGFTSMQRRPDGRRRKLWIQWQKSWKREKVFARKEPEEKRDFGACTKVKKLT